MTLTPVLSAKQANLAAWLSARGSVLVGFSGGVDSAFLAVTAVDVLGPHNMLAVLGVSGSLARDIRDRAGLLARQFGVPLREIATNELSDADYVANRGDRCFYCKRELWNRLTPVARETGFAWVVDGTITDDLREHRPGRAAGAAAGVQSPLAECGFAKDDVRASARDRGIPLWDAPSAPCLASRVAVGVRVSAARLTRIEQAERGLRALGIAGDLRVRDLGADARIELPPDSLTQWSDAEGRSALAAVVQRAGFDRVLLDARGYRRGALQERGVPEVTDITVTSASGSRDTSV